MPAKLGSTIGSAKNAHYVEYEGVCHSRVFNVLKSMQKHQACYAVIS